GRGHYLPPFGARSAGNGRGSVRVGSAGLRAALRRDRRGQRSRHDEGRWARIGRHRYPGQQRGELRSGGVRKADREAMGCDVRLQYARTVSGIARSSEVDAAETRESVGGSEDHQYGIARGAEALDNSRSLLLIEGSP